MAVTGGRRTRGAAPLVSQLGGYPTLYLSVAAITGLGSAFAWKICSVP